MRKWLGKCISCRPCPGMHKGTSQHSISITSRRTKKGDQTEQDWCGAVHKFHIAAHIHQNRAQHCQSKQRHSPAWLATPSLCLHSYPPSLPLAFVFFFFFSSLLKKRAKRVHALSPESGVRWSGVHVCVHLIDSTSPSIVVEGCELLLLVSPPQAPALLFSLSTMALRGNRWGCGQKAGPPHWRWQLRRRRWWLNSMGTSRRSSAARFRVHPSARLMGKRKKSRNSTQCQLHRQGWHAILFQTLHTALHCNPR